MYRGKTILKFNVWGETNRMDSEEILAWFEHSMEERVNMTWKEFGVILDKLGITKTNYLFEIKFGDGTSLRGNEIDWECDMRCIRQI